ncbi:MAG: hypothetical protein HQM15_03555 [Deltaproteobacteria bacterium]|nr:hypothetical protein [Deltaproteobacteria bacterium]
MKYTQYFLFTKARPDRAMVKQEWIESVIQNPVKIEVQADDRLRMWGKIEKADNRYLGVVLLEDHETVHNAFLIDLLRNKKGSILWI